MRRWNPTLIRWNPEVRRWNVYRAKHGALESSGVALECVFPQNHVALESFSDFLESLGCDAGKFLSQKKQRWNPSVFRWNPDSFKIMGRWKSSSVSLEPDSRKKMSRWNLTPLGTLKFINTEGVGAGSGESAKPRVELSIVVKTFPQMGAVASNA